MQSQGYGIEIINNFDSQQYDQNNNKFVDRAFGKEITNISQVENYELAPNILKKVIQKSRSQILPKPLQVKYQFQDNINAEKELQKISDEDKGNPQTVNKYSKNIFEYLKNKENQFNIQDYMCNQKDINEKMRAILVDWLVDVHQKYKMVPETLFLTVFILDKYLENQQISRQNLQLLGITALFIASKYEEIYPPHLKDFIEITDNSYTKNEVLDMEGKIIICLNFQITVPSSLRFLDRYSRILTGDQRAYFLARYLIELALIDYKFAKYSPSNIASSAIYLSMKIYKKKECWNEPLKLHTKFKETDIRICAKELCLLLQNSNCEKTQAVRRKFSQSQYLEISKIQIDNKQQSQNISQFSSQQQIVQPQQ